jgi:hypothetical protein
MWGVPPIFWSGVLTMVLRLFTVAFCLSGPLIGVAHGGNINGEATYISFSVPGAAYGTYPTGINASMEVTGYYALTKTETRGFVREADGVILNFNVPGARITQPEGINSAGDITGYFIESPSTGSGPEGFLRYADGRIVTFNLNPTTFDLSGSIPSSINDFDEVAGTFVGHAFAPFKRSSAGVLASVPTPFNGSGVATAINAGGSVVGYNPNTEDQFVGFVSHPDGYTAQILIPANPKCANETIPDTINDAGWIAGWYTNNYYGNSACTPNNTGGFVMSPDGTITLFQPPGKMTEWFEHLPNTAVGSPHRISIDAAGDVTGFSVDAADVAHGFVRNPYGTITAFDPPEGQHTFPTSINNGGVIAGYYFYKGASGPAVGFIRVP